MTTATRTRLRRAVPADINSVFRWRNEPDIVALSHSQRSVDLTSHREWFAAALRSPDRLIFIIEIEGSPAGQLRFDRCGPEEVEITIYLASRRYGHGHGSRALALGEAEVMRHWPDVSRLRATVLAGNERSLRYFERMGYEPVDGEASDGVTTVRLHKALAPVHADWERNKHYIVEYYDDLVRRYGDDPRSCDYGRASSQRAKFRAISEVIPLGGKRILDVGCGLANFFDYLIEHGVGVDYEGVDLSDAMLDHARRRHPQLKLRRLDILEEDPGTRYDVVTANGIFYLLGAAGPRLMPALVRRMYELAEVAVAFNSLSNWAAAHDPGEFYADPSWVLSVCHSLTPWAVLRHDYLPHDFTVYLYRDRR